jgi:hypothetical protein
VRTPRASICLLAACLLLAAPPAADAQVTWRNLVVTGGLSSEGYQGNLPAVSVAVRDSTEFASAVIGELGVRGELLAPTGDRSRFVLSFDGGMRQFSARGFELRDYAPREWVGTTQLEYSHAVGGSGLIAARIRARGREVEDRPPMPLFLQPGYRAFSSGIRGEVTDWGGRRWDLDVRGEWADYMAPSFAPQIRLLDRRLAGLELGLRPGWDVPGVVRLYAGGELSHYPEQNTFAPEDPFRRDHTLRGGASWTWQGSFLAQLSAEAQMNRSNSRRPEYDAASVRALVSASLPAQVAVTGYAALTGKRYRFPTDFARLIPGEEANSASQAYVSFTRSLATNLDGTFRLGWTRAETEIGGQYFQRYGASMLLNYRPGL